MALVRIVAHGDTHIGRREHNEDAILLRRELNLFALADGAGGENAGNVASSMALTTLGHHFEATEATRESGFDVLGLPLGAKRLSAAVHRANAEIVQLAAASQKYQGMGTTVVAASIEPERAVMHLAHVGDSRCYRLRAGIVELLTTDHSLMNDVLELAPELDEAKAKSLPTRVVTRALGMSKSVRVSVQSYALAPGDRYLLCSDGLTDQLEEEQIAEALGQDVRPEALVKILFDIAHAPEARDNIAVVVLDVLPTDATDWPSPTLRARPLQQRQPDHLDDDDEPELLFVEHDSEEDLDDSAFAEDGDSASDGGTGASSPDEQTTSEFPAVKLVPEPSPEKAAAIKRVLLHDLPEPKDERDPTIRFRRSCRHCGADFDGPADVCPFCWKAV